VAETIIEPGGTTHQEMSTVRFFHFDVPVSEVRAVLPTELDRSNSINEFFTLPNGDTAAMTDNSHRKGRFTDTCQVSIYEKDRPWYQRSWSLIRRRLGLHP
jgi:hypothetical protein